MMSESIVDSRWPPPSLFVTREGFREVLEKLRDASRKWRRTEANGGLSNLDVLIGSAWCGFCHTIKHGSSSPDWSKSWWAGRSATVTLSGFEIGYCSILDCTIFQHHNLSVATSPTTLMNASCSPSLFLVIS